MKKNYQIDNNEINLIELIYTFWEGKWKIVAAVVISLTALISYQLTQTNNFTAITEIKPIGIKKTNEHLVFNNLLAYANTNTRNRDEGKFSIITSANLLSLYIDILNDRSVFEDAIHKFNLLNASQYNNDQEYNEAVIRLASSIKILSPLTDINKKKEGRLEISYYTINFNYHDAEKWKSVLVHVDELANKLVKKTLVEGYNDILSSLKSERKYKLEDILTKINNYIIDYEREVSDRMLYLKEQSAIAKELGIAKNTIEVQTFGNQNALLSNIKTDAPFYLRGYEAINKEIELIQSRKDKKAFTIGLFELEKRKRAIEQDQTIKRISLALQSDLLTDKKFSAASVNGITTKFEYKNYKQMFVLVIIIGLIVGAFYVVISNEIQSHRVKRKND